MNALILAGLPILAGGAILVGLLVLSRILPSEAKKGRAETTAAVAAVPARGPEYVRYAAQRVASYRRGIMVFLGLVVLTALELVIALSTGNLVPLLLVAMVKAGLILYFFMHITTVWSEEEAH
jgi:cytochrome c oxidase subunit 4